MKRSGVAGERSGVADDASARRSAAVWPKFADPRGGRPSPSPTSCSSRMRISEPVLTSCILTVPSRDAVTARPPWERGSPRERRGGGARLARIWGGPEPGARTASRNARGHAVAAARSSSGVGRTSGSRSRSGSGLRRARRRRAASASASPRPGMRADEEFTPKMGRGGDAAPGGARGGGAERGLEPGAEEDALDALLGEIFPRYRGGRGWRGTRAGRRRKRRGHRRRVASGKRTGRNDDARGRRGTRARARFGRGLARGRSRARTAAFVRRRRAPRRLRLEGVVAARAVTDADVLGKCLFVVLALRAGKPREKARHDVRVQKLSRRAERTHRPRDATRSAETTGTARARSSGSALSSASVTWMEKKRERHGIFFLRAVRGSRAWSSPRMQSVRSAKPLSQLSSGQHGKFQVDAHSSRRAAGLLHRSGALHVTPHPRREGRPRPSRER